MIPIDDNVFVDLERVKEICHGIIDRKLKVQWRANCRFDYLSTYDKEFLGLLERAGCVELDFGGESGSPRLQELICKDVTADQMLQSVANLKAWAPTIEPYVSWMSGLPGETDEDLNQTFDLMDKMSEVNPKTQHYGIFVYTPFPSPLTHVLPAGFVPPQSLEEWGSIHVFHFDPPWHSKKQVAKLHTISAVSRLAFYPQERIKERDFAFKTAYSMMNKIEKYRWKHRSFSFPIELKIADAIARRFKGLFCKGTTKQNLVTLFGKDSPKFLNKNRLNDCRNRKKGMSKGYRTIVGRVGVILLLTGIVITLVGYFRFSTAHESLR